MPRLLAYITVTLYWARALYADADALTFRDYAALKLGVPEGNIMTLINEEADLGKVLLTVKNWLGRRSKPDQSDVYVFTEMLVASRPIGLRVLQQSIPAGFTVFSAAAGKSTRGYDIILIRPPPFLRMRFGIKHRHNHPKQGYCHPAFVPDRRADPSAIARQASQLRTARSA